MLLLHVPVRVSFIRHFPLLCPMRLCGSAARQVEGDNQFYSGDFTPFVASAGADGASADLWAAEDDAAIAAVVAAVSGPSQPFCRQGPLSSLLRSSVTTRLRSCWRNLVQHCVGGGCWQGMLLRWEPVFGSQILMSQLPPLSVLRACRLCRTWAAFLSKGLRKGLPTGEPQANVSSFTRPLQETL